MCGRSRCWLVFEGSESGPWNWKRHHYFNFKEVYIMSHNKIKDLFSSAIQSVVSRISDFAAHPGKDFTRRKKFPADKLLTFLISEGSSSTKNELLDFFDMGIDKPTDSAFNQQRSKLRVHAGAASPAGTNHKWIFFQCYQFSVILIAETSVYYRARFG